MNAISTGNGQANPAARAAWALLFITWICFLIPIPGLGLVGWPLNLAAFILAIVAMAKGGAMKGLFQLICSLVASPLVYFVGLAIMGGAMNIAGHQAADRSAAGSVQPSGTASANDTGAESSEVISVSAATIFRAYDGNEVAADGKYKGKRLLIAGTVDSIQSDLMDDPVVQLSAGTFQWVQLHGLSQQDAAALSKGQQISALCVGQGELIGFPSAADCQLR